MKPADVLELLRPLEGHRIRFSDGHEQDCVVIEKTIHGNLFLDSGKKSGEHRAGYYVMPHVIKKIEREDNTFRLVGYERSGAIRIIRKLEANDAEKAT